MERILIVEDNQALNDGIKLALKGEGRIFTQAVTAAEARRFLREEAFSLVILDILLPDGNGLELCRQLRLDKSDRERGLTPVLFLTANDTEIDVVNGLEAGGDDYVTKPFSLAILRARVEALLRRGRAGREREEPLAFGPFFFDFEGLVFTKNGQGLNLSKTEIRLLRLLIENRGKVLTREILLDRIWSDGGDFVDENALSVTIRRLRNKIEEDPGKPQFIHTVYGLGYTWEKRDG